jgi:DNA-binding IclR family transcriptional regulator
VLAPAAEGRTIDPELASVRRTLHELERQGLVRQLPDGRWEAV